METSRLQTRDLSGSGETGISRIYSCTFFPMELGLSAMLVGEKGKRVDLGNSRL